MGLLGHGTVDYIASLFAMWRNGIIACPINPSITAMELKGLDERIQATAYLSSYTCRDRLEGHIDTPFLDLETEKTLPDHSTVSSRISPESNSLFIQTSGSSGEAKTVVLTYSQLYYSARGLNGAIDLGPDDRWLLTLPLYHVGGIGVLVRSFLAGGTVLIVNNPRFLLKTIRDHEVTRISLVSTQLIRLLDEMADKPMGRQFKLKTLLLGGSAIPASLIRRGLSMGLPLLTSYGLSEMASTVTLKDHREVPENLSSSGVILKYRNLKIDKNDEIWLKGEPRFSGYWRQGRLEVPADADGWFPSGDLGRINDAGELELTGRRDRLFISGGENIQPEEIERCLREMPGIIECRVIAVPHLRYGHRPVAFLKTPDGMPPDPEQIRLFLKDRLTKFKIPDQFYSWPEIPPGQLKPSITDFRNCLKKKMIETRY